MSSSPGRGEQGGSGGAWRGGGSERQPSQEGDREMTGEMTSGESRTGASELCAHHLRERERESSSSRGIGKR